MGMKAIATDLKSPFLPGQGDLYSRWRDGKLAGVPARIGELLVEVHNPRRLRDIEREAMMRSIKRSGMALYAVTGNTGEDRGIPVEIGKAFGLFRLDTNLFADGDGITSLSVSSSGDKSEFIPYTNRPIHWHTDGYYNTTDRTIRGLLLHCVRPAKMGGENRLMDPEIVYILLREENPLFIEALMQRDAMVIPANIMEGRVIRPERRVPVFSVDEDGSLIMRYTARAKNILWKEDPLVKLAVERMRSLMERETYTYRILMAPGQGLVSNNVLHDRSGFEEDPDSPRLIYRARYYDRVAGS